MRRPTTRPTAAVFPHKADHYALDRCRLALDRNTLVARVLRLKSEAVSMPRKALHSRLPLDEGHHDLSRWCILLLSDDDVVSLVNPDTDHAVTVDAQREV